MAEMKDYPKYVLGTAQAMDHTRNVASIVGTFYKDVLEYSGSEELALALSRDLGEQLISYWMTQG